MSMLVNSTGGDDIRQDHKRRLLDPASSVLLKRRRRQQQQQHQLSLNDLPRECLFEILRRLPSRRERSVSACVSKRWLSFLSSIRPAQVLLSVHDSDEDKAEKENAGGLLIRCLGGRAVTDIGLASLAVGSAGRGGLGTLLINGSHPTRGATDLGFSAIARGCPSLRVLSLCNVPLVGDRGLAAIASGCPLLEKLEIQQCPLISDAGLIAIAKKCCNLTALTIDSCSGIANDGLSAIAMLCPKLNTVTIRNCPLVGDSGIRSLMRFAASTLAKLRLEGLNVTDWSLGCIGHYGKVVTDLHLAGLAYVAERGFWVMGRALGLKNLRSFIVTACSGVTDLGLKAVAKGCQSISQLCLRKCWNLSDVGLKAFAEAAKELENLQIEECHRISVDGVIGSLIACKDRIKIVVLLKCLGLGDARCSLLQPLPVCSSLRYLTIRDCAGLTSSSLVAVGRMCQNLVKLDLSGLVLITDDGLLPLVERSDMGIATIALKGCVNLTDTAISTLVKSHGNTLRELHLGGCNRLTDKTISAIADSCWKLVMLDMSCTAVTDYGVALLASARKLNLELLSLEGCAKLTKKSLPLLGNMGSNLVVLNLRRCNRIKYNEITLLKFKMWWCNILS